MEGFRSKFGLLFEILAVFFLVAAVSTGLAALEGVLKSNVLAVQTAHAAPLKGYEAMQVTLTGGGKILMKPGESKRVSVEFQNIGTTTWNRDTGAYVSLYTYVPKYRISVFKDAGWYRAEQPAKLAEASVAPKGVGHVEFTLRAPSTTGTYAETFALAAEDVAWIPGGQFTFNIVVSNETAVVAPTSVPTTSTAPVPGSVPPVPTSSGLSGMILIRSAKQVESEGGATISYTVGIKNTGTKTWNKREVRVPQISTASVSADTRDASWVSSTTLLAKSDTAVAPGSLDLFTFSFKAPPKMGLQTVSYTLVVDDALVPDLMIEIPVNVTSNAPDVYRAPVENPSVSEAGYIEEPMLRVGVLIVDDETANQVDITCESKWSLHEAETNNLLAELSGGKTVLAFYKNGKYYFDRGTGLESSSYPLRFVPDEKNSICKIANFDRRVTRKYTHPDNQFRNVLELRYNSAKDRTWVINELPIEYYLRGLAETSNISHLEFQKTLLTVARTYATYHWERGTKRGPERFHITAYSDDQVYNGYGQELRSPRITASVEATRGMVVTYDGKTAITPYFSRSDGRTRAWSEVWYGDVPWMKGVPTPCDVGKTLWGHGVGLSASEALCQANAGKEWTSILKYFYTGIDLTKRWK